LPKEGFTERRREIRPIVVTKRPKRLTTHFIRLSRL
jgi:hypothetical protein